jgi:hypothetical protein
VTRLVTGTWRAALSAIVLVVALVLGITTPAAASAGTTSIGAGAGSLTSLCEWQGLNYWRANITTSGQFRLVVPGTSTVVELGVLPTGTYGTHPNGAGPYLTTPATPGPDTTVLQTLDGSTWRNLSTKAANSNACATAPVNTVAPQISGTAVDGATLSVSDGTWTGTQPMTFTYSWQRCSSNGSGCSAAGTGTTFTLTAGDVGSWITATVTATNFAGTTTAAAGTVGPVAAAAPASIAAPQVTGDPQVGATLAASTGTWAGTAPLAFSYTWLRCTSAGCTPIADATNATYVATWSDHTATLAVTVTATNSAGAAAATSPATPVIGAQLPAATSTPQVAGTPQQGVSLTATIPSFTGTGPIATSVAWLRCTSTGCAVIDGATGTTYTPNAADVGATLVVRVTGTNQAGTATVTSAPTAAVAPPATIVADRDEVPAGGTVIVTGEGFRPGSVVRFTIFSTPRPAGTTIVAADGTFRHEVTIPADLVGQTHRIVADGIAADGDPMSLAVPITVAGATQTNDVAATPTTVATEQPAAAAAELAFTGTSTAALAGWAAAALLAGAALVAISSRARRRAVTRP